jgi:hypothetical protein
MCPPAVLSLFMYLTHGRRREFCNMSNFDFGAQLIVPSPPRLQCLSVCQSQFMCTALMLATMNSRADCMRLLLVSGADPEIKNVVR